MSYYGTISEADSYFSAKLYRDLWFTTDPTNKVKALNDATERIDRLNFAGNRTLDTQDLQFPRDGASEVPTNIKKAAYEIAFQLLDGVDPEIMYELIQKSDIQIGPTRTRTNPNLSVPEHFANGIPSLLAWQYVKPFLRDRTRIHLQRS